MASFDKNKTINVQFHEDFVDECFVVRFNEPDMYMLYMYMLHQALSPLTLGLYFHGNEVWISKQYVDRVAEILIEELHITAPHDFFMYYLENKDKK